MDEHLRHQRDTSLGQLEALIRRGRVIKDTGVTDAMRAWQQDCAGTIHQLSGSSKAHWLSRAYSSALLVRSPTGGVVVEADPAEIVGRILHVLAQAATSLSRMDDVTAPSGTAPRPRKFEFVHDPELRPVLEQAFADSRDALERREFGLALILSCSVIDAVLTDALDHAGRRAHDALGAGLADWSFETRIATAQRAGLIRGGCARLPPVARTYRNLTDADGELRAGISVSEREARLAHQVLHVVVRDLAPSR